MITERAVFATSSSFAEASTAGIPGNAKLTAASYSMSIAANLVATGFIAYRAW
jgi:hypothetical protein